MYMYAVKSQDITHCPNTVFLKLEISIILKEMPNSWRRLVCSFRKWRIDSFVLLANSMRGYQHDFRCPSKIHRATLPTVCKKII